MFNSLIIRFLLISSNMFSLFRLTSSTIVPYINIIGRNFYMTQPQVTSSRQSRFKISMLFTFFRKLELRRLYHTSLHLTWCPSMELCGGTLIIKQLGSGLLSSTLKIIRSPPASLSRISLLNYCKFPQIIQTQ